MKPMPHATAPAIPGVKLRVRSMTVHRSALIPSVTNVSSCASTVLPIASDARFLGLLDTGLDDVDDCVPSSSPWSWPLLCVRRLLGLVLPPLPQQEQSHQSSRRHLGRLRLCGALPRLVHVRGNQNVLLTDAIELTPMLRLYAQTDHRTVCYVLLQRGPALWFFQEPLEGHQHDNATACSRGMHWQVLRRVVVRILTFLCWD